jgi:ABC-type transport system involved in multi-copper enzyme maturation permease subunit
MIRQTAAIFVDAYRELNAKKMFWIVLALSGLFVSALACIGINDKGISLLWWDIPVPMFNSRIISRATFYKYWFFSVGFQFWLTWAATILALVSTAGIIPDFIGSGAIELALSKPIGRLRLFLTKYMSGLLFVTLQVGVFSLAAFVVLRVRGDAWVPEVFWSIPLVLAFFSYLFAICALLGMLTRSAIASLLLTGLVWIMIVCMHIGEAGMLTWKVSTDQSVLIRENDLERRRAEIEALKLEPTANDEAGAATQRASLEARQKAVDARAPKLESTRKTQRTLTMVHSILFATMTVLPKTSETMELLGRSLLSEEELNRIRGRDNSPPALDFGDTERDLRVSPRSVEREVQRTMRSRSVGWVLGTSLVFEVCVVGLAAWIFCRRDF